MGFFLMSPLFDKKEQDQPGAQQVPYQTQDQFTEQKAADQTLLITDLSHQLEEARAKVEVLQNLNRDLQTQANRSDAAKEALKELFTELWNAK